MRIIAGSLKGRQFASPGNSRTHPMSDKGRGALFNVLGDIQGLRVLDAFAGSGALSFEAISNGAAQAVAIDVDRAAQSAIAENIKILGLANQVKLIKAAAAAWLSTTNDRYDLVFLDPPFESLRPALLLELAARANVKGLVVLSLPPQADFVLPDNYEYLTSKVYGDNQLVFYRRIS
jgi:16S rRNA (guanine966-N2)-methyltransferase